MISMTCGGRRAPDDTARFDYAPAGRTLTLLICLVLLCAALPGFTPIAARAEAAPAVSLDLVIARYRSQLVQDIDQTIASVQKLRASVVAGDLAAAKQAWIEARVGWERSEVFTGGFVPELDRAIDAWPDGASGFHAIEAKLFGTGTTDVVAEVDAMRLSLAELAAAARNIALTPQGLLTGVARLAYDVGDSKADGGESRVSGTSIDDMRNNVDGIAFAYDTLFAAAIESRDRELNASARREIDELRIMLAQRDLRQLDQERLRAVSEELVLTLQTAAPRLNLQRPALD
jgi:iron uptake system EfeUOB component EfeO/EfeM